MATVKGRVVQAALKSILEPIFEADFYPVSYGFRPGRGVHGALEHLRLLLRPRPVRIGGGVEPRLPSQGAIEGDIKGCFDPIGHHALMNRLRRRLGSTSEAPPHAAGLGELLPACVGAKKGFTFLDPSAWWTIARWLQKKHRISLKRLVPRYAKRSAGGRGLRWSDGGVTLFETASVRVEQYKLGWMHEPYFATPREGKPGA